LPLADAVNILKALPFASGVKALCSSESTEFSMPIAVN
jgi:hypothetical protein